jgi:hypothetical protein
MARLPMNTANWIMLAAAWIAGCACGYAMRSYVSHRRRTRVRRIAVQMPRSHRLMPLAPSEAPPLAPGPEGSQVSEMDTIGRQADIAEVVERDGTGRL